MTEPWRRFEQKVDPDCQLEPRERARRAKISYKAFLRSNARRAAKTRAGNRARRDAATRRRVARADTPERAAAFEREQDDFLRAVVIRAAAERGERGLAGLAHRQLEVRDDCLLCRRPFTEMDRGGPPDATRTGGLPRTPARSGRRASGDLRHPRSGAPRAVRDL